MFVFIYSAVLEKIVVVLFIVAVLVSLVSAVLIAVGNVFAQGKIPEVPHSIPDPSLSSEWELVSIGFVFTDPNWTTVYVNTRSITHLPGGIVKVLTLWVPRGKMRREGVNALKKILLFKKLLLFKGKGPNNAKRLWYEIRLYKFNCEKHQIALLGYIAYSFEKAVLDYGSSQHEVWEDITPGSVGEGIEEYLCKKHKEEK